jgi:hypothetical protein
MIEAAKNVARKALAGGQTLFIPAMVDWLANHNGEPLKQPGLVQQALLFAMGEMEDEGEALLTPAGWKLTARH